MNTGNTETVKMTDVATDSGRQDGKSDVQGSALADGGPLDKDSSRWVMARVNFEKAV